MKYVNKLLVGCALLGSMTACEKDLPNYDTKACQLNFYYGNQASSSSDVTEEAASKAFSFVLNAGPDVTQDTIWLDVNTMGYLSDKDRPFELQQIATEGNDAVPGKHYIGFDNAELKAKYYFIPAGKASVKVPVVVLRDPSLEENDVTLKVTFKPNEHFTAGYKAFSIYMLTISDKLTKPSLWEPCYLDYNFGLYGSKKHELMIAWTGNAWDDAYLKTQFRSYVSWGEVYWTAYDSDYIDYLSRWLQKRLVEENAKRGEPYCEDDGTPVDFTPIEY